MNIEKICKKERKFESLTENSQTLMSQKTIFEIKKRKEHQRQILEK